jgi:hypothetical protein
MSHFFPVQNNRFMRSGGIIREQPEKAIMGLEGNGKRQLAGFLVPNTIAFFKMSKIASHSDYRLHMGCLAATRSVKNLAA